MCIFLKRFKKITKNNTSDNDPFENPELLYKRSNQ